jgi:hypothetical protein
VLDESGVKALVDLDGVGEKRSCSNGWTSTIRAPERFVFRRSGLVAWAEQGNSFLNGQLRRLQAQAS